MSKEDDDLVDCIMQLEKENIKPEKNYQSRDISFRCQPNLLNIIDKVADKVENTKQIQYYAYKRKQYQQLKTKLNQILVDKEAQLKEKERELNMREQNVFAREKKFDNASHIIQVQYKPPLMKRHRLKEIIANLSMIV